jgi:hypothetical protein
MGTLLLHEPCIYFYLLYVGALGIAFIWDYWRNPPRGGNDARTLRTEQAWEGAALPPLSDSQEFFSVSKGERRTDKEREHTGPVTTSGALRESHRPEF